MNRSVEITRAAPEHAPACAEILNDWIDTTPWMPRIHSPEAVQAHVRDVVFTMRRAWVTLRDDEPVGFLALDIEGTITALYVAATARGTGVGTALLTRAKGEERALELWTFGANAPARRFYAARGFFEIGGSEGNNAEGLPDVLLRWERGG